MTSFVSFFLVSLSLSFLHNFCQCATTSPYACYKDDVVIDIFLPTESDVRFIEGLSDIDAWTRRSIISPGAVNRIHTTQNTYKTILEYSNLTHTVLISNLEDYLQDVHSSKLKSKRTVQKSKRTLADDWYQSWHKYDEITSKLVEISKMHPKYTTFIQSINGKQTYEHRDISALRIGRNKPNCAKIALVSGEHAREWIGPGALMWILGRIVQDLSNKSSVLFTHDVDIYVVPCYNPDGYEYSRSKKRLWRKNRRDNGDGSFGVDLNRNWDNNWCVYGGSMTTNYQTYCGTGPFSEVETRSMSNWMKKMEFDAFIDLHSYAGQILRPYGYKSDKSPDEDRLYALSENMVKDIFQASGDENTIYESIRGVELYPASGASDDWAYENAGIRTVFTIEIAGNDFDADEDEIEERGDELYPAILRVIRENSNLSMDYDPSESDDDDDDDDDEKDSKESISGVLSPLLLILFHFLI